MDDRHLIDLVDPFQDALTEFVLGLHADLFEEGTRHLAKERLDDVEPGAVHGGEYVFEAVRPCGQKGLRLLG